MSMTHKNNAQDIGSHVYKFNKLPAFGLVLRYTVIRRCCFTPLADSFGSDFRSGNLEFHQRIKHHRHTSTPRGAANGL